MAKRSIRIPGLLHRLDFRNLKKCLIHKRRHCYGKAGFIGSAFGQLFDKKQHRCSGAGPLWRWMKYPPSGGKKLKSAHYHRLDMSVLCWGTCFQAWAGPWGVTAFSIWLGRKRFVGYECGCANEKCRLVCVCP